ncbi:hypothetical protein MKZ38_002321 [Zalerion maritima]|uniref:Uncharacterized protein n=1 Tax=Zalerion maritima TaxID=339359 RepID=A0AAD5S567_9PEZI|nr:hypothetical protein MKZ38_002321 [Zalerion maritima]
MKFPAILLSLPLTTAHSGTPPSHGHSIHRALHKLRSLMSSPAPPSPGIDILSWSSEGSGCPDPDDVAIEYASYGPMPEAITISYKKLTASLTDESSSAGAEGSAEKECNMLVHLKQQGGWQFAVSRVDYTGSAELEREGVVGSVEVITAFVGRTGVYDSHNELSIQGPFSGPYRESGTLLQDFIVFAPCTEDLVLNINATVRLRDNNNSDGKGEMELDPEEKTLEVDNHLNWKQCKPKSSSSSSSDSPGGEAGEQVVGVPGSDGDSVDNDGRDGTGWSWWEAEAPGKKKKRSEEKGDGK